MLLKQSGALAAGVVLGTMVAKDVDAKSKSDIPRWGMVVDLRRCTGCRSCTIACKSEFSVPLGRWNTVVKDVERGKYPNAKRDFLPRLYNHCEGTEKVGKMMVPPCVKVCPEYPKPKRAKFVTPSGKKIRYSVGATYKRPDGMVLLNNDLCIGCGKCIDACPYGARYFNPLIQAGGDKTKHGIGKCTFCTHRVDQGVMPSCVNTCPGKARIFGDLNDPKSEVSKLVQSFKLVKNRLKTTLLPREGTIPQVYYIDPNGVLSVYRINEKTKEAEFVDKIA